MDVNLLSLYQRYKEGNYVAPFVRRIWIEKEDGSQRPIGIPVFEDKILQRAIVMLLSAIYEIDFYGLSYGFRKNRGAHNALKASRDACYQEKVSVVIDADISKFFDNMPHDRIREIFRLPIYDGKTICLIGKWLKAGVVEDGQVHYPDCGSPQGGVISPILANIYLRYAIDEWFEKTVKPYCEGEAMICRYADDFVCAFRYARYAERLYEALPKRLERFNLQVAEDKTQCMTFSRFRTGLKDRFTFLNFGFYWELDSKGKARVFRRTAEKRRRSTKQAYTEYIKKSRHMRTPLLLDKLTQKLRGHYNYFGAVGDFGSIIMIYDQLVEMLYKWLNRRSNRKSLNWAQRQGLSGNMWLCTARASMTEEPDAGKPHIRICMGVWHKLYSYHYSHQINKECLWVSTK